eukprot:1964779-Ditylum_brightwellii.AAC.1
MTEACSSGLRKLNKSTKTASASNDILWSLLRKHNREQRKMMERQSQEDSESWIKVIEQVLVVMIVSSSLLRKPNRGKKASRAETEKVSQAAETKIRGCI